MTTKWTPGPWEVVDWEGCVSVDQPEAESSPKYIEVFIPESADPLPNARLIAAAPEMYEEIRQRVVGCHACAGAGTAPHGRTCNECRTARAILAKINDDR